MWGKAMAMLALATAASAQDAELPVFNAAGYRIAHYRGPIAAPPDGVTRIAPRDAAKLRPDRDALLIDVLPAEGGHKEADGRWRIAVARPTIPGAHWFPEAGRGEPDPAIATGFVKGIARLTHGNRRTVLIVFCLSDCWMSWNAAKRLHSLGYRDVRWLAEGTDGWRDLGLPLQDAVPVGGLVPSS
jgi:PQQ-dependent catabolism-associated CXXCW motif protein